MVCAVAALVLLAAPGAEAQSGSTLGKLLQGVLSKSDITVSDLTGEWTANGSAVSFKSDNMLKKAGGIAAAAAIESKLDPYFQQYGLTGAKFTFERDSTFSMQTRMLTLNGTISRNADGTFIMAFQVMKVPVSHLTAYIQKTSGTMDIMFDATGMKQMLNTMSKFVNLKSLKAANTILNSYDGLCVGFSLEKTGNAGGNTKATNSDTTKNTTNTNKSNSTTSKSTDDARSAANQLLDLLNKKRSKK